MESTTDRISSNKLLFPLLGLASSASGYACLVYSLASLYKIQTQDISAIARLGSGSACRSIYGGFVQWKMGESDSGQDSIAVQVAQETHWPEMRVLILVVSDQKKLTGSTGGMKQSVKTSELLKYRISQCVPQRIQEMREAIMQKDFSTFARLTMQDSNQFHAICLDTYPPCKYMNDISHAITAFVHQYNEMKGEAKVAYTFDAGPNACLYLLEENVSAVLALLQYVLPNDTDVEFIRGIPIEKEFKLQKEDVQDFKVIGSNLLKYIIYTKVGGGPKTIEQS